MDLGPLSAKIISYGLFLRIFAKTKPPVGYDLLCRHCETSRMFGDSSTALCLVSAAQLSSSPSSSPWRWIQVAGQEVASWTLALCAAQHRLT